MQWITLTFGQLSTRQLYDLLRLRTDVFVVEQNCPYPELDGHDTHPETLHLLGYRDDKMTAYARILPAGLTYEDISIGRVVTANTERGNGCGHDLVSQALLQAHDVWPHAPITIGAQYHLREFYRRHGFEEISEQYLEDGIPHIDMRRLAA
ncbi:GNAT family N-acetyltransferase [Enterovibrio coralii]|uniref:Protein ElaA n=1 Tax=Enterovibrio coralii TaxID=294935 RepID=A0A135I4A2_9GAMM|nr:GNAT family N-acetyltransferase [Enterovibrio coralii]KXF80272.1 GCN5 family acetyltransferase [Enterovibrio coralii]